MRRAGIIDDDIEPLVGMQGRREQRIPVGFKRDIAALRKGGTAGCADLCGERFGFLDIEVGNHDTRALFHEAQHGCCAKAGRAAGDDRGFIL